MSEGPHSTSIFAQACQAKQEADERLLRMAAELAADKLVERMIASAWGGQRRFCLWVMRAGDDCRAADAMLSGPCLKDIKARLADILAACPD